MSVAEADCPQSATHRCLRIRAAAAKSDGVAVRGAQFGRDGELALVPSVGEDYESRGADCDNVFDQRRGTVLAESSREARTKCRPT